jgi:hypothetical protein
MDEMNGLSLDDIVWIPEIPPIMKGLPMERYKVQNGFVWIHNRQLCVGEVCCCHNPTQHPLSQAPQRWRPKYHMLRVCAHNIDHPDPDHVDYIRRTQGSEAAFYEEEHECDGCCKETA